MRREDQLIRFDWAIKRILREKANFGVLEGLLSVVIGQKMKIIEILESEGNKRTEDDKFNRVDIKARAEDGEIIIVEVQNTREADYLRRLLYGVSRDVVDYVDAGDPYKNVRKVYSISVLHFDMGLDKRDYVYRGQTEFRGLHSGDELKLSADDIRIMGIQQPSEVFPEYYLLLVSGFDEVAKTPLQEWMRYLKTGEIDPETTTPGLQEARKKLKYISLSKAEQAAYDKYYHDEASFVYTQKRELEIAHEDGVAEGIRTGLKEGKEQGLKEGKEQGLKEGKEQGMQSKAYEIAIKLLGMGMSHEDIAAATGLTIGQIKSINC